MGCPPGLPCSHWKRPCCRTWPQRISDAQQQHNLFGEANEPIGPNGSAIDRSTRVLQQVKAGNAAAVSADRGLLESCLWLSQPARLQQTPIFSAWIITPSIGFRIRFVVM